MLRLGSVRTVVLYVFASVAFVGAEKPFDDLKTLAGDWRSMGNVTQAVIHINQDGTYEGIAASGARTAGGITVTGGTASYRSTTSEGTVTFSEESGKDVLTFVPTNGRGSAKLERVRVTPATPQTLDPKLIVGEWVGTWMAAVDSRESGQIYITVKSLEGEKATIEVEQVTPRGIFRTTPAATFRDNRLTWEVRLANQTIRVDLAVDGNKMQGRAEGIRRTDMDLSRKK
jgi:hypothetical protein